MMWLALIKQYWQVSLFKESPANTPYSLLLLGLVAFAFFILVVLQWMMADLGVQFILSKAVLAGSTLILSYGIFTCSLFSVCHVFNRSVQSLTCLFAGHTLIHLFAFPLLMIVPWLATVQISPLLTLMLGVVYLLLTLVLTLWQLMISAHIYKHALSIAYFPAVLASFGLIACNILMVSLWR